MGGEQWKALTQDPAELLTGVRVLDITRIIAGSTCSQMLACFGADVLLVGYRPRSMDRFGLSADELRKTYLHLVVGRLSAWGKEGSWARRPGFDSIVQAACGIAAVCSDGPTPGALPVQALDMATGYLLAGAVMTRFASGKGGEILVSLLGAARELLGYGTRGSSDGAQPGSERGVPVEKMEPTLVEVTSPHGPLVLPPLPLLVNGRTVQRDVHHYGGDAIQFPT